MDPNAAKTAETKTAAAKDGKSDDKTAQAATIQKAAAAAAPKADAGPYIVTAFNDRDTGKRYAPGDALPDHIRKDEERVQTLTKSGILSDKRPAARTAQQRVEGGLLTVTREDGRVDRGLAPEGFGDRKEVKPAPGAPETEPAEPPQG